MQKIVFIGLFCLFMLPASAFGHKLIPTDGTNIDYESALEIPNPVISWAMYEELQDKPLFYKFDAKKGDRLYSSIVIPKLEPLEDFTPSLVLIGPATFLELVDELRVLDTDKILIIISPKDMMHMSLIIMGLSPLKSSMNHLDKSLTGNVKKLI